jgi:hypothetical protein
MELFRTYYVFKKMIPRWLQIEARRRFARTVRTIRRRHWPIDRSAGMRPGGFTGWPGGRKFALVLRHDVETAAGVAGCAGIMDLERSFGMKSAFFFVPEDYRLEESLRSAITNAGCEVAVHGLKHDGRLYASRSTFQNQACRIREYLKEWNSVGFASPSSHHRFEWLHDLDLQYDSSSFDTDPFEPQPDGVQTIFPLKMQSGDGTRSFIELPYTLPQDFTLFVILQEPNIAIWKKKLDWVARNGGMALINTHPDYMRFPGERRQKFTYPSRFYEEFLAYAELTYRGDYWMALPRDVAAFWRSLPVNSRKNRIGPAADAPPPNLGGMLR